MTETPPSREKNLAYVPLLVLLAVAGVQLWLSCTVDLTPWKGGGFGMFSTMDSRGARYVRTYLVVKSKDKTELIPVQVPQKRDTVRNMIGELCTAPRDRVLEDFARRLSMMSWYRYDGNAAYAIWAGTNTIFRAQAAASADNGFKLMQSPPTAVPNFIVVANGETDIGATSRARVDFDEVRVQIWRYRYLSSESHLSGELLAEASARRPRPLEQ